MNNYYICTDGRKCSTFVEQQTDKILEAFDYAMNLLVKKWDNVTSERLQTFAPSPGASCPTAIPSTIDLTSDMEA